MPPASAPREDDDVIEDYEVLDEQPSRPAKAGGQPVLRKQPSVNGRQQPAGGRKPTSSVRPGSTARAAAVPQPVPNDDAAMEGGEEPPAYDPNKGKISHRASMQIWIACIAITVLGLGAVAADAIFDPLGRRNKFTESNTNKPTNTKKGPAPLPEDPIAKRAEIYKRNVEMDGQRVRNSKAYKQYQAAYYKFRESRTTARGLMGDEKFTRADRMKAWGDVFRDYYTVKYWGMLLANQYREKADEGFEPVSMKDDEARMRLAKEKGDDILKEGNVRFQAAVNQIDAWASDINQFWADKKNDLEINDAFVDEKVKPIFKAAKEKFENATAEPPKFDPADLEAVKE